MEALKQFHTQRLADLSSSLLSGTTGLYAAAWTILSVPALIVLMSSSGRRIVFTTADTVLAVVLMTILLVAILGLPLVALYIGFRGSVLMAKSLSENFPSLGLVLQPFLTIIGHQGRSAATTLTGAQMAGAAAYGAAAVPPAALH